MASVYNTSSHNLEETTSTLYSQKVKMPKIPQKTLTKTPVRTSSSPTIKSQKPEVNTGGARIVFRAYECLIHAEEAAHNLAMCGIFVGPNAEQMRKLQEQAAPLIKELAKLYKDYWKEVNVR